MAIDKKIKNWIERAVEADAEFAEKCDRYDKMVSMTWDMPAKWKTLGWVRKRVSTTGRDIVHQACNIFDTFNPKFEILPRTTVDMDAAEELERWGEFMFLHSNSAGAKEPFREGMRQSVTYDRICEQIEHLEDLPYDDPPRYPFCRYHFHPSVVHSAFGAGVLQKVAVVNNVLASDVLEHWEPYATGEGDGKSIKSAISVLKKMVEDDDEARVIYVDYTDKKKRLVLFFKTTEETVPSEFEIPDDVTAILDSENKKKIIPWVVVEGNSGSILESIDASGLWENQNFIDTAADSTVIRRLFYPNLKHKKNMPGGKELSVDYTEEASGVVELDPGEEADTLIPPPLDQGIREMMDRNSAKMQSSSGIQNLSAMTAANVQAATLKAIIDLKMTELEPYKRNAEKANVEVLSLMFILQKKSGKPSTAQRTKTTSKGVRGANITINPDDYDPGDLIITCTLLQNTQTDKMQAVNEYTTMLKAGFHIPSSEYVERLDMGNPEVLEQRWQKDQIVTATVQAAVTEIMGEAQLKIEALKAQIQMSMQQPPQGAPADTRTGQNVPTTGNPAMQQGFDTASGNQNNPGMGGNSPYESVPQGTQTVMQ